MPRLSRTGLLTSVIRCQPSSSARTVLVGHVRNETQGAWTAGPSAAPTTRQSTSTITLPRLLAGFRQASATASTSSSSNLSSLNFSRSPLPSCEPHIAISHLPSNSLLQSVSLGLGRPLQARTVTYGAEYQPSQRVRKRRHGFLARRRSRGGRKILVRRRMKGRRFLSH